MQINQPEELQKYQYLRRLSDQQIILLTHNSDTLKLRKGDYLLKATDNNSELYFLLEGELRSESASGEATLISADSEAGFNAITREQHLDHHIIANSNAALLRVDRTALKTLLQEAPAGDFAVNEAMREDQSPDKQLFLDIYSDLRNNKLALPSLPDVAIKVRQLIDIGKNAKDIAQAVNTDPVITAKLLKAANSPLYRSSKPFSTSTQAIVRIGLQTTKQLVTSIAIREVFRSDQPIIKTRMDALWQHATEVAALCLVFARMTPHLNSEQAMLAGLLHNIGKVPMLRYAAKYPQLIAQPKALDKALEEYSPELGAVILKRWNFSDDMVEAARATNDWTREHGGKADYCDVVQVARLHVTDAIPESAPLLFESIPAFVKVTQQEGGDDCASFKDDALDDIQAAQEMLNS